MEEERGGQTDLQKGKGKGERKTSGGCGRREKEERPSRKKVEKKSGSFLP